jgi:HEPN domain-containing protein
MTDKKNIPKEKSKTIFHLGSFDLSGKGPGTYSGGLVKLYPNPKEDLLASAESFLKAADRCLNSCKIEEGIEELIIPGTVCASFSCELFLKYILLMENDEEVKGHRLADLFRKCSEETQTALTELRTNILEILERNNEHFVEARYHHEEDSFSFRQQELLQTAEVLSRFVTKRYQNENA